MVAVAEIPSYLYLELTNICNANCIFCAYQFDNRPKTVMDEVVFTHAVEEYYEMGGRSIGLTPLVGEAFLDKAILNRLSQLKGRFSSVHLYTNASALHYYPIQDILMSGITAIYISTAPFERNRYRAIYRAQFYDTVLDNCKRLLQSFRDIKTSETTVRRITLSFRGDITDEECIQTEDFKNRIAPYIGEGVYLSTLTEFDSWSGLISESDLLPGMTLRTNEAGARTKPCARISHVQVTAQGKIRLCGCRYDFSSPSDDLEIGDIKTTTIKDAYNSLKAKKKRRSFSTEEALEICTKCSWYSSIPITRP